MVLLATVLLSCVPALPFYCGNIHVGCAGRTRVQTQAFTVSDGDVRFEDGGKWVIRETRDRDARIFWREGARDWIRIEADGRFSLRRYIRGRAAMTRGRCHHVPEATR
ncbi:MAG: hypothetical protein AAGH68_09855 [Pseudomonadota bacterium]